MKKILFTLFTFLIGINLVSAKDIALTCVYNNNATVSGDTNWKVGIRCVIYDDYTHQCYVERGSNDATQNSNKESLANWKTSHGLGWTVQTDIKTNKKCPKHIVFQLTPLYKLYAAKDENMAKEFKEKLEGTYTYYIATLADESRGVNFKGESSSNSNNSGSSNSEKEPDYHVTDTNVNTICSRPNFRKPMKFLGTIVSFLKIIIPIVIIGLGIIDLYKGVTGAKDDALKKSVNALGIRVVAGVFIFLLPGLIQFVLSMVNEWSDYQNTWCCCTDCLLNSSCDTDACNSSSCSIEGMNK